MVTLVTTLLKIAPLIAIGIAGVAVAGDLAPPPAAVPGAPVAIFGSVFALAFWNFVGIEAAAVPSEDVVDPARTVPRALVLGTATVGAIYLLICYVSLTRIPAAVLAASAASLAEVGRHLFGDTGAVRVALGALVSTAGCLNVSVLEAGQTAMAAARDRLFPPAFARLSSRHTPA